MAAHIYMYACYKKTNLNIYGFSINTDHGWRNRWFHRMTIQILEGLWSLIFQTSEGSGRVQYRWKWEYVWKWAAWRRSAPGFSAFIDDVLVNLGWSLHLKTVVTLNALMDALIYCPRTLHNTDFPASVRSLPPVTPLHSHGCLFTHTVHVNPAEHGPQYLEFARAFPRVTQSTWLGRNDDSPVSTATALTLKYLAEIHSESCGISTHCYVTQSMGYRHGCTNTEWN